MCMCNYRRFHNKTFLRFDMYHLHNAVIDSELKKVDMQFLNRQFTFGLGFTFCCNSSQFFLLRIYAHCLLLDHHHHFPQSHPKLHQCVRATFEKSLLIGPWLRSLMPSHHQICWSQLKSWFKILPKWGITSHKIVNSHYNSFRVHEVGWLWLAILGWSNLSTN